MMTSSSSTPSVQSNFAMSTAKELVEKTISDNEIAVFCKSTCPYSNKARAAITELNLNYTPIEVDHLENGDQILAALLEITGQKSVPNIFVKGKHIGGCDNTLAAIASGEFQRLAA